jgi:hypothetical protein
LLHWWRARRHARPCPIQAALWLADSPLALTGAALALDLRIWGPRDLLTINGGRLALDGVYPAAGVLAWASTGVLAIGFAGHARVINPSPLHRNRLRYWISALTLIAVGTGLTLSPALRPPGLSLLGGGLVTLLGSFVAVIAWRTYYLPDMRVMLRRTISYVVITLVTFAIYFLGILVAQLAFRVQTGLEPLFGAVVVAVVLALGYAPLRQGVQQLTRRVLGGAPVDYTASLQDYSQRITQVLDLNTLASMVLQTAALRWALARRSVPRKITHSLDLQRRGRSRRPPTPMSTSNPITQRWREAAGASTTWTLPTFRRVTSPERAALAAWKMEVFSQFDDGTNQRAGGGRQRHASHT